MSTTAAKTETPTVTLEHTLTYAGKENMSLADFAAENEKMQKIKTELAKHGTVEGEASSSASRSSSCSRPAGFKVGPARDRNATPHRCAARRDGGERRRQGSAVSRSQA
jgi:hypothetical protein